MFRARRATRGRRLERPRPASTRGAPHRPRSGGSRRAGSNGRGASRPRCRQPIVREVAVAGHLVRMGVCGRFSDRERRTRGRLNCARATLIRAAIRTSSDGIADTVFTTPIGFDVPATTAETTAPAATITADAATAARVRESTGLTLTAGNDGHVSVRRRQASCGTEAADRAKPHGMRAQGENHRSSDG